MNRLLSKLQSPYPIDKSLSYNFKVAFVFGVFTLVFNWLTEFSFSADKVITGFIFSGLVFTVLFLNLYFVPRIFPNIFREEKWKTWKEILWTLFQFPCIACIGFCIYVFSEGAPPNIETYLVFLSRSLAVGGGPVIGLVFFEQYLYLKRHLRNATWLREQIRNDHTNAHQDTLLTFQSTGGSDHIKLAAKDLLFVESADNYSRIIWLQGEEIMSHMIRKPLKRVEAELTDLKDIFRCHRTCIVNFANVESLTGNAQGYKLKVRHYQNDVPVARSFVSALKNHMHDNSRQNL